MAKRYKKGNKKKKKVKQNDAFYKREKKLNKLIGDFVTDFRAIRHKPLDIEKYRQMDSQRLEIKRLFDLQSKELFKQSRRRKRFYYKQLNRFKYNYVGWKRCTYYIYLYERFDCPLHLSQGLKYYFFISKDIKSTISQL